MNNDTTKKGDASSAEMPQQQQATAYMPAYDPTMIAYHAYQETMRQFLRTQEQIMRIFLGADSMGGSNVADQFGVHQLPSIPTTMLQQPVMVAPPVQQTWQPPVTVPVAQQQPVIPQAAPQSAPVVQAATQLTNTTFGTSSDIRAALIGLISDKTGYPEDMIADELDLEADLGVDSIKRVEIFQKFAALLSPEATTKLVNNADRFVRIKQFSLLVETLNSELNGATETLQKQHSI